MKTRSLLAQEEFVNRLEKILNDVQLNNIPSAYHSYLDGLEQTKKMRWKNGACYFTDCTGLICGVLRDCDSHRLRTFYKDMIKYALNSCRDVNKNRKGLNKIYPPHDKHVVFAEDMHDFVAFLKSTNWDGCRQTLQRGDLLIIKEKHRTNATGHAMIYWGTTAQGEVEALECSCRLGGIGLTVFKNYELKDYVCYRLSDYIG